MKAIYGRKVGMTQVFADDGKFLPVTVIECTPNVVYQVKSQVTDSYDSVQVGIGQQKQQRVGKAQLNHFAKAQKGIPKFVAEIRLDKKNGAVTKDKVDEYKVGDSITIENMFEKGSVVDVVGTSIGKGFAGVMKRHNMKGFIRTHGTHEYFRHGGSIGCRKFPGRVFKNKRMGGHMGVDRVMQQGLTIVDVLADKNLLLVKGSVPGPKNGVVFVRQAVKA